MIFAVIVAFLGTVVLCRDSRTTASVLRHVPNVIVPSSLSVSKVPNGAYTAEERFQDIKKLCNTALTIIFTLGGGSSIVLRRTRKRAEAVPKTFSIILRARESR